MIEQYYRFREQLEPEEIIFDPLETPLLPEDPDWPTPRVTTEIKGLLQRLPRKAQVFCGLIAAQKAFPVFQAAFPNDELGAALLSAIRDWLAGNLSFEDLTPIRRDFHERLQETEQEFRWETNDPHGHVSDEQLRILSAADSLYFLSSGASLAAAETRDDVALLVTIAVERAAHALGQFYSDRGYYTDRGATPEFLNWWWSECRRRLAFRDAPTVELAGRRTLGALQDYQKKGIANLTYDITKRRLEEPEPSIYYPTGQPLMPDDPEWKTPKTLSDATTTFTGLHPQLSGHAAAVAGLTAAEMVLPNIARVYPDWTVPEEGLEVAWRALQKETRSASTIEMMLDRTIDDISDFYEEIREDELDEAQRSAGYAMVSAQYAIKAVQRLIMPAIFGEGPIPIIKDRAWIAVLNAAWSDIEIDAPRMIHLDFSEFLRRWWSKVRRRLAVRDIEEFELD